MSLKQNVLASFSLKAIENWLINLFKQAFAIDYLDYLFVFSRIFDRIGEKIYNHNQLYLIICGMDGSASTIELKIAFLAEPEGFSGIFFCSGLFILGFSRRAMVVIKCWIHYFNFMVHCFLELVHIQTMSSTVSISIFLRKFFKVKKII